jgi:hypothetical protein
MKKPALLRASKSTAVFVIAAALFVAGLAGSTLAYFDGQTDNVAVVSGGYVFPPVTVTTLGSLTGPIQTIKWAQPTTTGVNSYELRLTNMGTTAVACPANRSATVMQTVLTTTAATITTTKAVTATTTVPLTYPETVGTLAAPALTAPATVPAGDNGSFVCFQVAGAQSIGGWYSPAANANGTAVRVGLWPNTVALANHGTNNSLNAGDTIIITYSQNVSVPTSNITVCAFTSGTLIIGDLNSCSSDSDSYSIGTITGLTIGADLQFTGSKVLSAGTAGVTVTVTGAVGTTTVGSESGTGAFMNPTDNSVVTTPGSPSIPPCTLAGCSKANTGHF